MVWLFEFLRKIGMLPGSDMHMLYSLIHSREIKFSVVWERFKVVRCVMDSKRVDLKVRMRCSVCMRTKQLYCFWPAAKVFLVVRLYHWEYLWGVLQSGLRGWQCDKHRDGGTGLGNWYTYKYWEVNWSLQFLDNIFSTYAYVIECYKEPKIFV